MGEAKSGKGGIKSYWRKRATNYSRLRRPPISTVVLGSAADCDSAITTTISAPRRRRFWRIPRRIRFLRRIGSPKRWLARLRDAYVKMMLRLANVAPIGYGYGYGYGYGNGGDGAFGVPRSKEYDPKMLADIYKELLISQAAAAAVVRAEPGAVAVRS